jgi:UPF0716 protein FxsA
MFLEILFLIVLAVGIVDLVVMVEVSNAIGIYIVTTSQLLGAAFGWYKLRRLDFNLFFFLDAQLKNNLKIIRELWDEAFVLTGVCFLIVPGFLSDIVGIICLIPKFRFIFLEWID